MIPDKTVQDTIKNTLMHELESHLPKPLLIAANWKMNMNRQEATQFIQQIGPLSTYHSLVIFPAFTTIGSIHQELQKKNISFGAQNMHFESSGAFTGEISPSMLVELGCQWVLLGHSERRTYNNETNITISLKICTALKEGLRPLLCIGENLHQRKTNSWQAVLALQLTQCLQGILPEQLPNITIAYEPIWAIGTGITANCAQIQETHHWIKGFLSSQFGYKAPLLYGGSVNENNARQIAAVPEVDGFLIGGASLKASTFTKIVKQLTPYL